MNLVADASALVGELSRARGRALLQHPELDLFVTMEVASEVRHEIRRRLRLMVERGRVSDDQRDAVERDALTLFADSVNPVLPQVYAIGREAARTRIHDPHDWSTVALATILETGIWTEDRDFFGIGLPLWSTRVLLAQYRLG